VADHDAKRPESVATERKRLESFLIDLLREHPGLRFGAIIARTEAACAVPRRTTARHLARLVRYGEVTLAPDRTYALGATEPSVVRPTLEYRWREDASILERDGSAREVSHYELRVVAGRLDHVEWTMPQSEGYYHIWSSAPGSLTYVPSTHTPTRQRVYVYRFDEPLSARDAGWHRFSMTTRYPHWYRTTRDAVPGKDPGSSAPGSQTETNYISIPSEGRRFGVRFAEGAHLLLQILFPPGYPVAGNGCHVRYLTESDRSDPREEERIARLSAVEGGSEGLRAWESSLSLSVPDPILDRRYELEWGLPSLVARQRWLRREIESLSAMVDPSRRKRLGIRARAPRSTAT
jgi:hypothetical protein